MYSRADNTQRDAQVDGGPIGAGLPAVTALPVPRDRLDVLQRLAVVVLLIHASSAPSGPHDALRHGTAALSLITHEGITTQNSESDWMSAGGSSPGSACPPGALGKLRRCCSGRR